MAKKVHEYAALLNPPRISWEFSEFRNHVIVLGSKPVRGVKRIWAEALPKKQNEMSPQSMARNGEPRFITEVIDTSLAPRTKTQTKKVDGKEKEWEKPIWASVVKRKDHAKDIAQKELDERMRAHVTIEAELVPQPHLELGDWIQIETKDSGLVDIKVVSFSKPLTAGSPMTLGYTRDLKLYRRKGKH